MSIRCCNGCVPPKRTPYCHTNCPDYIAEKIANDAERERKRKENAAGWGIYHQRTLKVEQARKNRKG